MCASVCFMVNQYSRLVVNQRYSMDILTLEATSTLDRTWCKWGALHVLSSFVKWSLFILGDLKRVMSFPDVSFMSVLFLWLYSAWELQVKSRSYWWLKNESEDFCVGHNMIYFNPGVAVVECSHWIQNISGLVTNGVLIRLKISPQEWSHCFLHR